MSNKLTKMAREILAIENDLPYRTQQGVTTDDFNIHSFEQVWGSTALGFGGIGGQAMTEATTYVFIPVVANEKCHVYFAGSYAYSVDYSEAFMKDVYACNMESVSKSGKYKKQCCQTKSET